MLCLVQGSSWTNLLLPECWHQLGLVMSLYRDWRSLNVISSPNITRHIILHRPSSRYMIPPGNLLQTFWSLSALQLICPILKLISMHFGYQLCAALALHVISISCSLSPALPAQGVRREALSLATLVPRVDGAELKEKQPVQIVLMGCPEMFNQPVHACSSCGGESPTEPGTCKDANASHWYCKCTSSCRGMCYT